MHITFKAVFPQPTIGVVTMGAALLLVVPSWTHGPLGWRSGYGTSDVLLSLALMVATLLAFQFSIHIGDNTKINMNGVPLYLMAVLLSPPLAAVVAGFGMLAGEVSIVKIQGTYASDIATQVGRSMVLVFLGSALAHVPMGDVMLQTLPLAGAGAVLWVGDMLTIPLLFGPATGAPPVRLIKRVVCEAGLPEGAEYLMGLMGALVARQQIWALVLLFLPTALVYLAFRSSKEMREGTRQVLESMADYVDLRDPYTGGHSRRVTELTAGILSEMPKDGPEAQLIIAAARVHDIGKIAVPDDILKKASKLSSEERLIMRNHADRGAELLMRYPDFARVVDVVRHHHERWDGEGYPYRLKGTEIPLGARIIAVADSFDAMTSDRPYRRALAPDKAASILIQGRAKQWDPAIVDALLRSIAQQLHRPATAVLRIVPAIKERIEASVTA